MDDPWDVKSVRQSGQYISCMKLNGAPLLPPVLSKECRKEMQYYKLLAKEVEHRISLLQPFVSDTDSEATNDAPELPEHEQSFELAEENPQSITSNLVDKLLKDAADSPVFYKSNDLSDRENFSTQTQSAKPYTPPAREIPERDTNCKKNTPVKKDIELITEVEVVGIYKSKDEHKKLQSMKRGSSGDSVAGIPLSQDGPSSLSSKSFTGSLNDLHSESIKDSHVATGTLIRQHSYTLLSPSPLLLAHLKVQSQNTGVEMNHISMSESLSNVSKIAKKRRSWDLETAKAKWSTMALELKQKNVINIISKPYLSKNIAKSLSRNLVTTRTTKSVAPTPTRRSNGTPKQMPKSEPIPKTTKRMPSPVRNNINSRAADTKQPSKVNEKSAVSPKQATPISTSEDPATRVRELYEKIQKQQLAQMANLVEKQKKEQMLLQQVFEEQNCLLFKQLKTICPKSPIEVKEAWGDKEPEVDRGPVSLSQLINYKSPDSSTFTSPASSTLTDTNNHLNHCDDVLRQSRNITGSLKSQNKSRSQNGTKIQSARNQPEGSRTRTHSPVMRRLNYDTSISSDRDYDPMLTDRTNDTLADLNVTFPTDNSDDGSSIVSVVSHGVGIEKRTIPGRAKAVSSQNSTENAIKSLERNIHHSINSPPRIYKQNSLQRKQPTTEERAAATKIVAHVKGYLVRRLMVTERVQGTVQTIKDALLCALQLHQDREGIRGADVDLHRRLIQQITAACYTLHDTFIASTPAERCAMIAADRGRRRSLAAKQPSNSFRQTDIMSQSHSGAFPARAKRHPPSSLMTQSNYETFSGDKSSPVSRRYVSSPRRRPWR